MATHKCIYCLNEKDESEFNREHVVPQMMGTYQNGYVLNKYQVCKECNSYFSTELEDKIGLDSYEALLRMQHKTKPISDGHSLRENRVIITGQEDIFSGLQFDAISDSNNPYRMALKALPRIGIINDIEKQEYTYFTLENLPIASNETIEKINKAQTPIINTGIPEADAQKVLLEKGYLIKPYKYSEVQITDLYTKSEILTSINIKIDSIVRRLSAKTVLNYLCYVKGVEFVLRPELDDIRKYIRYGIWNDDLWFEYSKGPITTIEMPNNTAHTVGYMWYSKDTHWNLCGCVTWFGDLTYTLHLAKDIKPIKKFNFLDSTHIAVFDNVDRTITIDDAVHIFGGRSGQV